jgi:hypothetical protein
MITNYFSPLEFIVTVKRLPNIEFFTQRTQIPTVSATPVEKPNPFNRMFETPDKLTYDNFNFSFIIDEKMNNYLEVYNWLKGITFPQNFDQFKTIKESKEGLISDISILILNSNKNPSINITYKNCFPISLSEITLDTTSSDLIYPEATVTFQYDYYEIEQVTS